MFRLTYLNQLFFQICFYLHDFLKFVRLLFATLSINGFNYLVLLTVAVNHV